MATSTKAGKSSERNAPARRGSKDCPGSTGGMLDLLVGRDTGYPDNHSKRRLPGNGEYPVNPFGGSFPAPKV